MKEFPRQIVHLSGLVFVLLAIFIDKYMISMYFFMVSAFFMFYSIMFTQQRKGLTRIKEKFERGFKHLVRNFEREDTKTPFIGAFWLYFAFGLTLLIFPLPIAIISCFIVAVSDSLSTIIGMRHGKRKIIGDKTLEGTLVFFISAFLITMLFINFWVAIMTAIVAAIAELIPEMKPLRKLKEREILNDNFTVPIITAIFLTLVGTWFQAVPFISNL